MQQSSSGSSRTGSSQDGDDEDNISIPQSPSSKAITPYTPKSEAEDISLQELVNYCEYLDLSWIRMLTRRRSHIRH